MKATLDKKYGADKWCLFYLSLHKAIHYIPLGDIIQIAVKGLKQPMVHLKLKDTEVRAYQWANGTVYPSTPFKDCSIHTFSCKNRAYNIPSEYDNALELLYGNSYREPYSKYTPPDVAPIEQKKTISLDPIEPVRREGTVIDMGVCGTGEDLTDRLTVCFLDGRYDINKEDALQALREQSVKFNLLAITGFSPLADALNAMKSACKTKYFIQVDNDMVLYKDGVKTLFNFAEEKPEDVLQVCLLWDILSKRNVQGCKIYNTEIIGSEKWLDVPMPTPDMLKRLDKPYSNRTEVVGAHSPKWSERARFDRGADLANITRSRQADWVKEDMKSNEDPYLQAGYNYGINIERNTSKSLASGWSKCAKDMGFFNVLHIIDQYGWAFDIIANELRRYSNHNISILTGKEFSNLKTNDYDVVHVHGIGSGLDIVPENKPYTAMGQYSGYCKYRYSGTDYELSISPHINDKLNNVRLLQVLEGIDTYYWLPSNKRPDEFTVGWSGRHHAKVKRTHLLKELCYPVQIKADWGKDFFVRGRTKDDQREFYHGLSCLVLTSESECIPRVLLEAMSCGIPVIAPRVGKIPQMLYPEWVVDVEPDKCVAQINERLKYLADNPEIAKSVGAKNRRRMEQHWSWFKLAPIWDSLYIACHNKDEAGILAAERAFKEVLKCPVK